MKNERTSNKEVILLGAVYVGLLSIVILLPEAHPTLNGFILALYAVISYVAIERVK